MTVVTTPIDNYFAALPEPTQSCLVALRQYILGFDTSITEMWSYGMPFYKLNGKRLCYLCTDKHTLQPYLGIVDGNRVSYPGLIAEKRSRMKIFNIDASKDLPLSDIDRILLLAMEVNR